MLKQEHTIGFCDGVMCVTKILENKENGDSNKHCVLTNGDMVRSMSDEELINFYFGGYDDACYTMGTVALMQCAGKGCANGSNRRWRDDTNTRKFV